METLKKYIWFITFSLCCTFSANQLSAQNLFQEDPSPRMEEAAKETAEMWAKELVLSGKQFDLMKDKIAEFLLKKNSIVQSDLPADVKTRRLKELQILQFQDMRDILTGPQHRKYVELSQEGATPTEYDIVMPED